MIRILAGLYKNRALKIIKGGSMRPTLVRTRKVVFDTLAFKLDDGYTFLDVFAGSGSMGIEALSRGSRKVYFFEINKRSLNKIKENLISMPKIEGTYHLLNVNSLSPPQGMGVDAIYIDPPYEKSHIIGDVVKKLIKYGWLKENTLLITETHKSHNLELGSSFLLLKEKLISKSLIRFYTYSLLDNEHPTELISDSVV